MHRNAFGVQRLCQVLGVHRSAYYKWLAGTVVRQQKAAADAEVVAVIRAEHAASGGTYGVPRIHAELRDQGRSINRKRVARLMRCHDIAGLHLRRRKRTTIAGKTAAPVPDLLGRDFTADAPNIKWCGDITYLKVGRSWMFLATVIDLYSRRLIGYSMADHMRADLVVSALRNAVAARGGDVDGVIFHADHGSQYTSEKFAKACAAYGIRRSMGAVGSSTDNAVAEAWFAALKRELPFGARWATPQRARLDVFAWISFYNNKRRHSTLGYLCPAAYESHPPSTAMLALAA
jgi:transposase InsO family protein